MFEVIDPFDYTALQTLEDHLDIHCFCATRPSAYCPVHNPRMLLEAVESRNKVDEEIEKRREEEAFEAGRKDAEEDAESAAEACERAQSDLDDAVLEALDRVLYDLGVEHQDIVQKHANIMAIIERIEQEVRKLKAPEAHADQIREQVEFAQKALNAAMDLITGVE